MNCVVLIRYGENYNTHCTSFCYCFLVEVVSSQSDLPSFPSLDSLAYRWLSRKYLISTGGSPLNSFILWCIRLQRLLRYTALAICVKYWHKSCIFK